MKRQIRFSINFFLLFIIPIFVIGAQPQSFFISPQQSIDNGTVIRAYCLEYSKDVLRAGNLAELTRMTGNVRVIYNNGKEAETSFQELYQSEKIVIYPFDSYQHMQIFFLDETIEQLQVGHEGIGLFRKEMTEYEDELTITNIQKILELEALGKPHTEIQDIIWRTRIIRKVFDEELEILTIDFQTTDVEEDRVRSTFNNSATVNYERDGRTFLRLDGLLINTDDPIEHIIELITHYHRDHISLSILEQTLRDGIFTRMIGPYPTLDESRNEVFSTLSEYRGTGIEHETQILDITVNGEPLNLRFTPIGNFIHSAFRISEDIYIEIFKYQFPREPNHDGFIYQITHKNVKYLLFGDFDDIDGIENLLDASAENERQRIEKREEVSNLMTQLLEAIQYVSFLNFHKSELEKLLDIYKDETAELTYRRITSLIEENEIIIAEISKKIEKLEEEISRLPVLKADVIKWMHHAHVFPANERADNVIRKLNDVVDPQYIIWERYSNQSAERFEDYIERFNFREKCLSSEDMEIIIISLEWLKDNNIILKTGEAA